MFKPTTILVLALAFAAALPALAKDAYFSISVRDLKLAEGELPKPSDRTNWRHYERSPAMQPYAVLDGAGEAYLDGPGAYDLYWPTYAPEASLRGGRQGRRA